MSCALCEFFETYDFCFPLILVISQAAVFRLYLTVLVIVRVGTEVALVHGEWCLEGAVCNHAVRVEVAEVERTTLFVFVSQGTDAEGRVCEEPSEWLGVEARPIMSADEFRLGREAALPRPYFARITVQFPEETEEESFYIGSSSVSNEHHEPEIIDWRSPIAEVYYNQALGETSYMVDDRKIPVDLKLRRQFDLERDVLKAYFDTKIALEDPLLIHSLTKKRSDKMQSITETIQKEQNLIIRYPDVPVLLVQGIAGSGKTSVLLQRIAYLFYRRRHTLRPNQVALITLNPVFQQYIDHVLPEMGEANPVTMTWSDFLDDLGVKSLGEADITEADALHQIDEGLVGFSI